MKEFFRHLNSVALIDACLSVQAAREKPTLHGLFLSQPSRERLGVDSRDIRYLFAIEPLCKGSCCRMIAIRIDQVLSPLTLYLNPGGFESQIQTALGSGCRYAIVSNEGIREYENLTTVGRIRHCLDVPGHAGIEDNLTGDPSGDAR